MPEVSEIRSNLPRSTKTYDEEMALPPSYLAALEGAEPSDRKATSQEAEAIEQAYITNYLGAAPQRWEDQQRFMGIENQRRRFVNLMHPHRIFRHLRSAGVDARIDAPEFYVWQADDKTGRPILIKRPRTTGRLWLHDEAVAGRVGVSAWVWDKQLNQRVRKAVTSFEYPFGPEWSLMEFDEFDVPIRERWRGWRTAMLHLIEANVLTEDEVTRAFGPVALDSVSLTYRKHLYYHRQRRYGLIQ